MAGASVSFDRAAAYYDDTRGRTPEAARTETSLLAGALAGRGTVLEIGVGTGQVALPVHAAGIPVVGLDISSEMLAVMVGKAGGRAPFPLIRGDATALPFPAAALGAAMFRWVLHVIPGWRDALAELVRVVAPGGLVLANLAGLGTGPKAEIQWRFAELAGVDRRPVGLGWDDVEALDREMRRYGATLEELEVFEDHDVDTVGTYLKGLEENRYSWTWPASEHVRRRAAAEVRVWAEAEFGPLDALPPGTYVVRWRAYHLP